MKVLAVIPARIGSTRIERKNLQPITVATDTLLSRAVQCALDVKWKAPAGDAVEVCVSTDSPDVANAVFWSSGVVKTIARAEPGDGPMARVLVEAYSRMDRGGFDCIVCLQPTSPFRTWWDVARCISMFAAGQDECVGSVVSVRAGSTDRNGAVYVMHPDLPHHGDCWASDGLLYEMDPDRSLDVNEPADLERAREIAREKGW